MSIYHTFLGGCWKGRRKALMTSRGLLLKSPGILAALSGKRWRHWAKSRWSLLPGMNHSLDPGTLSHGVSRNPREPHARINTQPWALCPVE